MSEPIEVLQARLDERQNQTRCECQFSRGMKRVYTCERCEELEAEIEARNQALTKLQTTA